MSLPEDGLDLLPAASFDVSGVAHVVPTRHGPVTVTAQGADRSRPALVTYHDVGLNHRTCFQPLFVCAGPRSDLVSRFCAYHIDAPGPGRRAGARSRRGRGRGDDGDDAGRARGDRRGRRETLWIARCDVLGGRRGSDGDGAVRGTTLERVSGGNIRVAELRTSEDDGARVGGGLQV